MIASVDDAAQSGLIERARAGDMRALARAISIVEDRAEGCVELLAVARASGRRSLRIGVTGPPGAGKSTLVDQMVRAYRGQGKTVGVIAVDPSSPYTGGALLGDRIRMAGFAGDDGVYIRSMATRGASGGLAEAAADVCAVMEAAGREVVIVETVGAGQAEIDIAKLADVTVVVLVPGMGDEVQSLKAGMMEIADVFVVNKADCDGAERVEAQVRAMQGLSEADGIRVAPIVRTVATTGEGVRELVAAIEGLVANHACGDAQLFSSPPVRKDAYGWGTRPSTPPMRDLTNHPSEQRALAGDPGSIAHEWGTRATGLGGEGARLDHIGIAVKSIAAVRGFYEALGLRVSAEEIVQHEQVKTAMLPLGETRLELLEATATDSTIAKFIAKRGEGLHHIAIHVSDVDAVFARLKSEGMRLASDCVRAGAGGHRYFFVHPASAGGVLVEIVGDAARP